MRLAAALLLLLTGCSLRPAAVILSKTPIDVAGLWSSAAGRRIPNALIVVCHGSERGGVWTAKPDAPLQPLPVAELAGILHAEHPDRPIVLLICNPAGEPLSVPGVFYARSIVWQVPDCFPHERRDGGTGSIQEFTGNP